VSTVVSVRLRAGESLPAGLGPVDDLTQELVERVASILGGTDWSGVEPLCSDWESLGNDHFLELMASLSKRAEDVACWYGSFFDDLPAFTTAETFLDGLAVQLQEDTGEVYGRFVRGPLPTTSTKS